MLMLPYVYVRVYRHRKKLPFLLWTRILWFTQWQSSWKFSRHLAWCLKNSFSLESLKHKNLELILKISVFSVTTHPNHGRRIRKICSNGFSKHILCSCTTIELNVRCKCYTTVVAVVACARCRMLTLHPILHSHCRHTCRRKNTRFLGLSLSVCFSLHFYEYESSISASSKTAKIPYVPRELIVRCASIGWAYT